MTSRFLRFILRIIFGVRLEGDLSQLQSGRVLIVANHDSVLDGPLLGLFLPGNGTVAESGEGLRNRLGRLLMRVVPHVTLDPHRPLRLRRL